ncbi:MAG TPA: glycosyltransferase family 2 protein [Candidatus Methanofastidiosa archaeon]|nr:glycosyltransferase family 2 protein [Candidatus Methanofastidiosa archaeon]
MFVAIIPAYNEELTIGSIVAKTRNYIDKVIVIDDGSQDATAAIAEANGATVVRSGKNYGKAHALCKGIEMAQSMDCSVVMLDADGQHNPDDIPKIIEPIVNNEADLVIGSRFINGDNGNIPPYRQFGQKVLNKFTNISANSNITDSQSGFRAINKNVLDKIKIKSNGFNVESDMICHFSTNGLTIKEVPIYVRYDTPNNHTISPISQGLGVLYNLVGAIGYHRPLLFFGSLSFLSGIVALYFGIRTLSYYWSTKGILVGSSLAFAFMVIISINALTAGLILNQLLKYKKDEKI